ncbi:MAG: hypothetical protein WCK49_00335 [Myxococcaceae bacterium]
MIKKFIATSLIFSCMMSCSDKPLMPLNKKKETVRPPVTSEPVTPQTEPELTPDVEPEIKTPAPLKLPNHGDSESFDAAFKKCSWISLESAIKSIQDLEKITKALLSWPKNSLYLTATQKMASELEAGMAPKLAFETVKKDCVVAKYLSSTEGQKLEKIRDQKLEEIMQGKKPIWSDFLVHIKEAKQKTAWKNLEVEAILRILPDPKDPDLKTFNTALLNEINSGKDLLEASNAIPGLEVEHQPMVAEGLAEKLCERVSSYENTRDCLDNFLKAAQREQRDPIDILKSVEPQPTLILGFVSKENAESSSEKLTYAIEKIREAQVTTVNKMLASIEHGNAKKALHFFARICGNDTHCEAFKDAINLRGKEYKKIANELLNRLQQNTWNQVKEFFNSVPKAILIKKEIEQLASEYRAAKTEETDRQEPLETQVPSYHSPNVDNMLNAIKHGNTKEALKFVTQICSEYHKCPQLEETLKYASDRDEANRFLKMIREKTPHQAVKELSIHWSTRQVKKTERDIRISETQIEKYNAFLANELLRAISFGNSKKALKFVFEICGTDSECLGFEENIDSASNEIEAAELLRRIHANTPFSWNPFGSTHLEVIEQTVQDLCRYNDNHIVNPSLHNARPLN